MKSKLSKYRIDTNCGEVYITTIRASTAIRIAKKAKLKVLSVSRKGCNRFVGKKIYGVEVTPWQKKKRKQP